MLKQVLKSGMLMTMTCVLALNADAQSKMDKPAERTPTDSKAHPVKMISTIESAIDKKQNTPKSGRSVSEGFEYGFLPQCWTSIDADGDGSDWFLYELEEAAYEGSYSAASASWTLATGPLTPDNYLVSPQLLIGADEILTFQIAGQDPAWPAENFGIYVSTTGNEEADFTDELLVETLDSGEWQFREVDMADYAGQEIYIAFRHFDVTDQFYIKLDDIVLPGEFTDVECVNVCAELEFPTVASEEVTCMAGEDDVWYYVVEFTDGGSENFTLTNSANATEEAIEAGTITAGPFDNNAEVTFTITPVDFPDCAVTATMTGDCTPPPIYVDGSVSFEGGTTLPVCWTPVDEDGDSYNWSVRESANAFHGDYLIGSDSYFDGNALSPDNYLITPQLTLAEGDSLYYVVGASSATWYAENYSVLVSTTGNDIEDFTEVVFTEVLTTNEWQGRNIDLSAYDNQDIYIAFRHHDVSNEWALFLDAIVLPGELTDEACIDNCVDLEYPTISGADITCSEDGDGWIFVLDLSDTGNSAFNVSNSENENVLAIEESGVMTFGPFPNGVEVTLTFSSVEFEECTSSISATGDCTEPCDVFAGEPYNFFNTEGIPVPDENGVCDVVIIDGVDIWMSEAYSLADLPADVTYVFSACDEGESGSWPITYTVYDPAGEIVAFGTEADECSISWITETEGDYVVAINRVGYCGTAAAVNNGFPSLTCSGTVGTIEKVSVDAVIYPNPATQDINVLTPLKGDAEIRIFDAVGRMVKSSNLHLNGSLFTQDLSSLVNGIYTMQIATDNGVAVTKFVKQ